MGREEGEKHIQEWVLKLKLRTGAQNDPDTTFPNGGALPFPGWAGEGAVLSAVLPLPPFRAAVSILGYQMAFWEPGITTTTYKLFIELKVISISREEEYEE